MIRRVIRRSANAHLNQHAPAYSSAVNSTSEGICLDTNARASNEALHKCQEPVLNFYDTEAAFRHKSLVELMRASLIFHTCRVGVLVRYAEPLYETSKMILGSTITHKLMRESMFKHFCGGETSDEVAPAVKRLRSFGVGGIFDYAAEAQVTDEEKSKAPDTFEAKTYSYTTEDACDLVADTFAEEIEAVHRVDPEGFAAIKLSGLGHPKLMERMSTAILELRRFAHRLREANFSGHEIAWPEDADPTVAAQFCTIWNYHNGEPLVLTEEQFCKGFKFFFDITDDEVRQLWQKIDHYQGGFDYIQWTKTISLAEISALTRKCRHKGPLYNTALNEEELRLMEAMKARVARLSKLAKEKNVRLMIDAEWVSIQPAIDNVVLEMQRTFNQENPVIFQTYQCYLKGSFEKCERDIARSIREGWHFGAKMVRGAYVVSERENATRKGVESPIWDTYDDTEKNFHRIIDMVLTKMDNTDAQMLVASHNVQSVEFTVNRMHQLGMSPSDGGVHFGQLLGMADNVSYTLGSNGYKVYKYVPYGPIKEVIPYLLRRTQENSSILGSHGVVMERQMIGAEIRRRLFAGKFR